MMSLSDGDRMISRPWWSTNHVVVRRSPNDVVVRRSPNNAVVRRSHKNMGNLKQKLCCSNHDSQIHCKIINNPQPWSLFKRS